MAQLADKSEFKRLFTPAGSKGYDQLKVGEPRIVHY